MFARPIIIAIDGFSSTGKSSFAKRIAKAYRLVYLDSGALYRCVTLYAMKKGFIKDGVPDSAAIENSLSGLDVSFSPEGNACIDNCDVEARIRMMDVSSNVSAIAALACVRAFVDKILHKYGNAGGIVMDGRDIGTTVFPNAELKIFMTADIEVRARRRLDELTAKGIPSSMEEVLKNLAERDKTDTTRSVSPLRQAADACVLDNSSMTFDDQMRWVGAILRDKFGMLPVAEI